MKKSIRTLFHLVAGIFLLSGMFQVLQAQAAVLSVQGVLRKNDGKAVDDGTYTLKFSLWKDPVSTNNADKVWDDYFNDVEIAGGVYNVLLGTGTKPLDAPFDQTYYLGVSMGSGSELQPRPMLTSAPFVLSLQGESNIIPSTGPMGVGTARPDTTAALLAVESITQGMLVPRMTATQRNAISSPASGLLIFQTNSSPGFYFYNGTAWQPVSTLDAPALQLGDSYEGGLIFYLDATGQHGLVAAPNELANGDGHWSQSGTENFNETEGIRVGSGQPNTLDIIRNANDPKNDFVAAYRCHEYVLDGYSDWFLPSRDELELMYTNLKTAGKGNFQNAKYWSSCQDSSNNLQAWTYDFSSGAAVATEKNTNQRIRPVRAF